MNVTIVSANIRYSAEAKGAWRTIKLGAEADVAPNEDWHTAQEELYHQLGQQMKALWHNGKSQEDTPLAPEKPAQPTPAPQKEHLVLNPQQGIPKVRRGRACLVHAPQRGRLVPGEVIRYNLFCSPQYRLRKL
jgi:hypothetical protein